MNLEIVDNTPFGVYGNAYWSTQMTNSEKTSKTTFHVDPEVLRFFQSCIATLRLRRDRYLDNVLPIAVGMLQSAKVNSPTAAKLMRSIQENRKDKLQKIAIRLSQSTIESMNTACAEKGVPRNQFFEAFLKHLIYGPENGWGPAPLAAACDLIEDPFSNWATTEPDETPFDHIIIEDLEASDLTNLIGEIRSKRTEAKQ